MLKSYRLTKKKAKKKKKRSNIISDAANIVIGLSFLSETSRAVSRI